MNALAAVQSAALATPPLPAGEKPSPKIETEVQHAAREYLAAGFKLVAIPAGSKGPAHVGWNKPTGVVRDVESLTGGVGLAHAYSRTAAVDFDDLEAATAWLANHAVDVQALWTAPDAVRISSGRVNRGKLLYRLPAGVAPLPTKKIEQDGRTLFELRCASANGLTVQDVLPPSGHPSTGRPYAWEYGDPLLGHWSVLPELPPAVLAVWQSLLRPAEPDAAPDHSRLGLTPGQLRAALRHADPSTPYDEWLRLGMACHHESGGQPYGLDVWDEWSAASDKYPGRDAIEAKWDSFGRDRQSLVTGRYLLSVANVASADDFEDLTPAAPGAVRFPFESADAFAARPLPTWIVKDVLPQAGLAVVFGASGSGKTFLALDLAAAVALGLPWRGHKSKRGRVAYLVAEGAAGFRKRVRAYCQWHNVKLGDDALVVHGGAPNLLLPGDTRALIESLQAAGELAVVVIDTAAQVTPGGNENTSEDMGRLVAHCRKIHEATGALVLLIHHSGKDASKGARGWSGLRAAVDAELEVIREDNGVRTVTLSKQKDAADGDRLGFTLRTVEICTDEDGDPVTSCVVEPCDAPARKPVKAESKTQAQAAFEVVRAMLDLSEDGQVTTDAAHRAVAAVEPFASIGSGHRAGDVARAIRQAVSKGWLAQAAGRLTRG